MAALLTLDLDTDEGKAELKKFFGTIGAESEKASKKVKKASDETNIWKKSWTEFNSALEVGKKAFNAVYGAIDNTVGVLARASVASSKYYDSLDNLSKITGTNAQKLEALSFAGEKFNVTQENIQQGLKGLTNKQREAQQGSEDSIRIFQQLGVQYLDFNGQLRNSVDLMGDVAKKFSGMKDGAEKNALALKLFEEEGARFIRFFDQAGGKLDQYEKDLKSLGAASKDVDIAMGVKFQQSLKETGQLWDIFTRKIGTAITPGFLQIVEAANNLGRQLITSVDWEAWAQRASNAGAIAASVLRIAADPKGSAESMAHEYGEWGKSVIGWDEVKAGTRVTDRQRYGVMSSRQRSEKLAAEINAEANKGKTFMSAGKPAAGSSSDNFGVDVMRGEVAGAVAQTNSVLAQSKELFAEQGQAASDAAEVIRGEYGIAIPQAIGQTAQAIEAVVAASFSMSQAMAGWSGREGPIGAGQMARWAGKKGHAQVGTVAGYGRAKGWDPSLMYQGAGATEVGGYFGNGGGSPEWGSASSFGGISEGPGWGGDFLMSEAVRLGYLAKGQDSDLMTGRASSIVGDRFNAFSKDYANIRQIEDDKINASQTWSKDVPDSVDAAYQSQERVIGQLRMIASEYSNVTKNATAAGNAMRQAASADFRGTQATTSAVNRGIRSGRII